MKEFEKNAIFSLVGAILFSYAKVNKTLGFFIFLISFFLFYFANKNWKYIFFAIPILTGIVLSYDSILETGQIYKLSIYSDAKVKVNRINDKIPKNNYYLNDNYFGNRVGNYQIKIKLTTVEKLSENVYIGGEILEIKESYFNRYRVKIRNIIERTGYSQKLEAFSKAIILGEKNELGKETKDNYRYIGATHILAISGLHINIVIIGILTILHYFSFGYKSKYILSLIVLSLYIAILGYNPAILRAYIMGVIFLFSKIFYEKAEVKKSYCISLMVIVSLNPNVIRDLGFSLSFLSLFGIIYIYQKYKKENIYYNAFLLSFAVQITLIPVMIYYFKTITLYSFVFNVFIVIWAEFLICLIFFGLILESLRIGFLLRTVIEIFYEVFDVFINTLAKIKNSYIEIEREIPFAFFILLIIVVITLLINKKYAFYLVMLAILFYNLLPFENKKEKNFYYFSKEKVLIILNEKKSDYVQKYIEKADTIVSEEYYENKKNYNLKKGEKLKFGKLLILKDKRIECFYDDKKF